MAFGIVTALLGLFVVGIGYAGRRRSSSSEPVFPTAKIEDGSPVPSRAPSLSPPLPISRTPMRSGSGAFWVCVVLGCVVIGCCGIVALLAASGGLMYQLGRPVRVRKRVRVGRRARGTGWHDQARPCVEGIGAWRRAWLGERWLAAARLEHASVPAFQRLEAQLVALRAPEELVRRCRAAAADEVRHARRCFAIARTYAGIDWTAGALTVADDEPAQLVSVAVESLVDGCVGEGLAADLAQEGAIEALDPVIRESLAMIARDEAVHAELAWDVLAFCLDRGGAAIETALIDELPTIRRGISPGPTGVGRARCQQIANARIERVRERLSTLIALHAETN